jgi:hypothetical protein
VGGSNFVTLGAVPDPQNDGISASSISLASSGTVVAAVAGKRIGVFAMHVNLSAAGGLSVQELTTAGATVTNQTGSIALASGVPLILDWQNYPWYTANVGNSIFFSLTGAAAAGRLLYMQG